MKEKLKEMMDMMIAINELEFRDSKEVSPKALALIKGQIIGASIPCLPNVNINDIANVFFKEVEADAGVFTSEAWLSFDPNAESPSRDPERVEVVLTVGACDGETIGQVSKIIRKSDELVYLEEYQKSSEAYIARCFDGVFTTDTIGDTIGEA